jgi:prepilin-type N-terminal cleavage/methylation domain-containing protein
MVPSARRGFTLIELLIVVVVIGILVAIAMPKHAATKDKAKLASVKSDVRNIISAEEAYFSDYKVYANWNQLRNRTNTSLSSGNTAAITSNASGFTATVTNNSITKGFKRCRVRVGAGATAGVDGVMVCS